MVTPQNIGQPQAYFPSPTQAFNAGFRFLKNNFGIAIIFDLLTAAAAGLAVWVLLGPAEGDSGGTWAVAIIGSVVLAFLSALFRLVQIRRGLDYWDETHDLAKPRSFSEAVKTAIEGAQTRLLPYIGWSLAWAVVFAVSMTISLVIAFAFSDLVALLLLLVVLVGALVVLYLANFFLVAAADRPGNPLARSFHVFKNHVMRVTGTYLLYYALSVAISVVFAIVLAIFTGGNVTDSMTNVVGTVIGVILAGAFVGSDTEMYRAVYGPPNAD